MRRLFVLAVLLSVMLGLKVAHVDVAVVHSPLLLAAIGFVVLSGFALAELGARIQLPQVTGFILCGVVLGPSLTNILDGEVVRDMKIFNDLALGLIATSAGLELELGQLIKRWRTLTLTIFLKVVLCLALVGGSLWMIQTTWSPLDLQSERVVPGLAILFGALAIGTSPAIVLAVAQETKAKGPLTELALGAAVAKDVVVVLAVGVAVTVLSGLAEPSAQAEAGVLAHFAKEVGASVLAGAVLGALLIAYMRFVKVEMLIVTAATVLAVSELGKALHLEILLVFIVAGCVVRNASRHAKDLHGPLELVSMPIFVIFFTIAGASLKLGNTMAVLPVAAVLVLARYVAFWMSAQLGGRAGGEAAAVRDQAVWAYLPQAGVTLGLVGLAAQRVPSLQSVIEPLGAAVVTVHLLAGPFTLRRALRVVGEIPDEDVVTSSASAEAAPDELIADTAEPTVPLDDALDAATRACSSPTLRRYLVELHSELQGVASGALESRWGPWMQSTSRAAIGTLGTEPGGPAMRSWAALPHGDSATLFGRWARDTFDELRAILRKLPVEIPADLEAADLYANPTESLGLRLRKLATRAKLTLRRAGERDQRRVPLRALARTVLEPELATWSAQSVGALARAQAQVFDRLRGAIQGRDTPEAARRALQRELALTRDRVHADLTREITKGVTRLAHELQRAGGPRLPANQIRYSSVEPRVRGTLRMLSEHPADWRERLQAEQSSLRFVIEVEAMRTLLREGVRQHLIKPSLDVMGAVRTVLIATEGELAQLIRDIDGARSTALTSEEIAERVELWTDKAKNICSPRIASQLEERMVAFRAQTSVHHVTVAVRKAVRALPEELTVTHSETPVRGALEPASVRTRSINLRRHAAEALLHGLLPGMEHRIHEVSALLASVGPRLRDAADIAIFALDAPDGELPPEPSDGGDDALGRSLNRITRLNEEIAEVIERMGARWEVAIDQQMDQLLLELKGAAELGSVDETSAGRWKWAVAQVSAWSAPLKERLQSVRGRVTKLWRGVMAQSWSQELQEHFATEPMDALSLRHITDTWRFQEELPDAYSALFEHRPLRDLRHFVVYREHLNALLEAERAWMAGGASSALVLGAAGAGKTSLLNLAQLEFNVPRLLQPAPLNSRRELGFVNALAIELGCRAQRGAVLTALRKVKTAVVIDDLGRWLEPGIVGVKGLSSLLELITQTREHVFWLVSINLDALAVMQDLVPIRQSFGRVIRLEPLSGGEIMEVIESRHAESNRALRFPRSTLRALMGGLEQRLHRQILGRVLAMASHGNLGHALAIWRRSVSVDDRGDVVPRLQQVLMVGLPNFRLMHPVEVALLVHTLRFRTTTTRQAAQALGQPVHRVQWHMGFLRSAGLLTAIDARDEEFEISRPLLAPVMHGLTDIGVSQ